MSLEPVTSDVDVKADVRRAVASLADAPPATGTSTSDLSIDEELNLHSIGWEPVELVSGVSVFSVPVGMWNWGQGEIMAASEAHQLAFKNAIARLNNDAAKVGGHGVVGVHVEREVYSTHVEISLLGTAVRPVGAKPVEALHVFVSDLSARDFTLLMVAGWQPLGLASGASFVYAPRRSVGTVLQQQSQNVELRSYTEAMYSARETAMTRMQEDALALKGDGVVEVKLVEGPMSFASHAVGFAVWGTVVHLTKESHQLVRPTMVVSLNDFDVSFDPASLA
ncbi:MAG: heavy metal-binding domain-containing protein [Acidimicrobiales bacterium]